MDKLIEAIAGVSNQWRLAAFAIAAILLVVMKRSRKPPAIAWAALFVILIIAVVPFFASLYAQRNLDSAVYRIRVTVLDRQNVPVEKATVWSSAGGEPKKVPGGWEFNLPSASKPVDGKVTLYASVPDQFLQGSRHLTLTADRNPTAEIALQKNVSATVRGLVTDDGSHAMSGAHVSVIGYESEAVVTGPGGNFILPAHSAEGEEVELHAEKTGFRPVNQLHPAGDTPATIVLDRK
jgi:hypothetical protein